MLSGLSNADLTRNADIIIIVVVVVVVVVVLLVLLGLLSAHRSAGPPQRLPLLQMASTPLLAWRTCSFLAKLNS